MWFLGMPCKDWARIESTIEILSTIATRRGAYELYQLYLDSLLNLLLEDWGKTTWVKQIMKKTKIIVFFIQQHHAPLAIFCCYETNLMFLNLIETIFATNFLMVVKLFKLRFTIEQIVAYPK